MKTVVILRHAKSSWTTPGLSDFDRPLNERGHRQLKTLDAWLADNPLGVDHIVCSPARRTRQTLEELPNLARGAHVEQDRSLYEGTINNYVETIWSSPETSHVMALIGHNPNCDELVRYLASPNSAEYPTMMRNHYSTATLSVLRFDSADWQGVQRAKGQLDTFLRPKMIGQGAR